MSLEALSVVRKRAFFFLGADVFEEAGEPKLRVTVRGNPDYALGANDPGDVVDLFSFEMP